MGARTTVGRWAGRMALVQAVAMALAAPSVLADSVPVTIGALPPGKSVTVRFRASVKPLPLAASAVSNQATISGTNFVAVDSVDPTPEPGSVGTETRTAINRTPSMAPQSFGINSNSPAAAVVGSVVASDVDSGQTLSFGISSQTVPGAFSITTAGELRVASQAAMTGGSVHTVNVTATDNGAGPLSASAAMTITVNAVTLSVGDASVTEGNAGQTPAAFTITLSGTSNQTVTAFYVSSSGSATLGADFQDTSGSLSFSGATTSQVVNVPVNGDLLNEPDETFTLTLTTSQAATIDDGVGDGTIGNDDPVPTIDVVDASATEGNAASADTMFTVTLSNPSAQTIFVDWATANGTATTADADYTASGGLLSFIAGDTSKVVTVSVNGDTKHEGDEAYAVDLSNLSAGATPGDMSATGTIGNDDALPAVAIADASSVEGDAGTSTMTFTATLANPSDQAVTVDYATAAGSATAGTDYVDASGMLTFAAGDTVETFDVTVNGDGDEDGTEDFTATLSNVSASGTIGDGTATGTILDDDAPFAVNTTDDADDTVCNGAHCSLREALLAANSRPGTDRITFTIPGAAPFSIAIGSSLPVSTEPVIVDGTTQPGFAGTPVVEVKGNSGTTQGFLLNGGASTVKGLVLSGFNGQTALTLGGPGGSVVTGNWIGVGTTGVENSVGSLIGIAVASSNNVIGGTTAAARNVIGRSSITAIHVEVGADGNTVQGNSIGLGVDGVTNVGNFFGLVIDSSGNTVGGAAAGAGNVIAFSQNFAVYVVSGTPSPVGNQVLGNVILNSGSATAIDLAGDGVTPNDGGDGDTGANLLQNFPELDLATNGGSSTTVTGTLNSEANEAYRVEFFSAPTCDASGHGEAHVVLGSATVNIDGSGTAAFTVALPVVNMGESISATATDAAGNTSEFSECVTVTAPPSVSIAGSALDEDDGAAVFTVTLSGPSAEVVSVNYSLTPGTATSGADYDPTGGTVSFAAGETTKTVGVTVVDDTMDESNETFTVTLSGAVHATLGTAAATGTITDNDAAPTVNVSDVTVTEGDGGYVIAHFTLTLSNPSALSPSINYATANGTAVNSYDFAVKTGTYVFNPGQTLRQIAVHVYGDTVYEPTETFYLNLSAPVSLSIGDGSGEATIIDNDPVPMLLSVSDATVTEGDTGRIVANFTVTLSHASAAAISFDYATSNGTAVVGDYRQASGTLTMAAGQTSRLFGISVNGDTARETTETYTVTLSNVAGATPSDTTGVGTILDNDPQPTVSIADVTVTEGDTARVVANFTVTLSVPSYETITVDYATAGGTATQGPGTDPDFQGKTGSVTFTPGQLQKVFGVTVYGDVVDEADETFTATLSSPTNASIGDGSSTGTIIDNE